MLRTNELRINNIVKYYDDDTIFRVIRIDELGIGVENEEQSTWIEYDCFSGIELTNEWLTKLGFEKVAGVFYHTKNDRLYVDITNPIAKHFGNADGILVMIDYVHQLQNIYFAITRDELFVI